MEPKRGIMSSARRLVGWVLCLSLAASAVLLVLAAAMGGFGVVRTQVLLTFVGLAVGALLGWAQLAWADKHPWRVAVGLAAIAVSQASYLLLVWTGWRTQSLLWRVWWVSMVPSVMVTHLILLRAGRLAPRDVIAKVASVCALVSGLMILALGLRGRLLADVPPAWLWAGLVPSAGAVLGSAIVLVRFLRRRRRGGAAIPRGARIALILASQAGVFFVGWYVGRGTAPRAGLFEALPSAMANLPPEEIDRQIAADVGRLRTVVAGLGELEKKMEKFHSRLAERLAAEGREYYTPKEDEQLRWQFVSYLSYRSALLRLVATYSGFQVVRDPARRARCLMLGHAAAATVYEMSLKFVGAYRDKDAQRRKLNEAEPAWGIPAGMFDRIGEDIAGGRNVELCEEMAAYFDTHRARWRREGIFVAAEFDWLEERILAAQRYARANPINRRTVQFDLFLQRVRQDAYTPVYTVQSIVSEWLGDTRIVQRAPFISYEQIEKLEPRLRPGDILLERRNWFVSNAFLPGFWPHAALYVGRGDDLRALGIAEHEEVRARLPEYGRPAHDGRANTVIEAVSEGVIFNSLTHSMHADYVAVLRPRLSDKQIGEAIVRAFRHVGKPYDFEFDFFTSDKLVCTELIYRSYEGMLHFPLKRVMGRDTLPAIELVRKFTLERARSDRELDFVLFLDAVPAAGQAKFADEQEFCNSADRPRSFNE